MKWNFSHLATLIGLFIREKIRREFDYIRYKLQILAIPGSLQNEADANRQGEVLVKLLNKFLFNLAG